MPSSVNLSNGATVHFKKDYTHRMESTFKQALTKGMTLREKDGEVVVDTIQADALDRAVEAVLELCVDSIEKGQQKITLSTEWLQDLPEKDFAKLRRCVEEMRTDNEARKSAGEKNR